MSVWLGLMWPDSLMVSIGDVRTADASVRGSRSTGFSADVDGRGSCSVTKFVNAD